jgi:L-lactate dehydrogenase complex protein LldG
MSSSSPSARHAILSSLRAAGAVTPVEAPRLEEYYAAISPGSDRVATFVAAARGWRAEVIETTDDAWPQALMDVLDAKSVRHLLAGRNTPLSPRLEAALQDGRLLWYESAIDEIKTTLFDTVDAGITTTLGGIVETGSLILWPDADEPRTLSLVPPLHIAVLHEDRLFDTLYAAIHAQRWVDGLPANALLITGPSKTSDIQRLLVYGAHGPRELVILLIRSGRTS